ncbi:MAG TPA: hypothetical protein VF514_08585 [Bacteroidota bacterium]
MRGDRRLSTIEWGVRFPFRTLGFDLLLRYAVILWYSLSAFSIDIQY